MALPNDSMDVVICRPVYDGASDEEMAVTAFRPRPDTSASWRIERASAMGDSNHVIEDCRFLFDPFRTQTYDNQGRASLADFSTSILVHFGSRRMHIGVGIARCSPLRPRASLSRNVIKTGTRGDISAGASASFRYANVIPRSSSTSIRSNWILTTGPNVARPGPFRTRPVSSRC